MKCRRCRGNGWICEAHPWLPFPHDACSGPGQPCDDCQATDGKPQMPADWQSITSVESTLMWTVRKDGRALTCRIRDDSRLGAGFDVQVFDGSALIYSQRCPLESGAQFLSSSLKSDWLQNGYHDAIGPITLP